LENCEKDENLIGSVVEIPPETLNLEEGKKHIEQVQLYMQKVVRPYLEKRKDFDAKIWIRVSLLLFKVLAH